MSQQNKIYLISGKDLAYLFRTLLGCDAEDINVAAKQCNVDIELAGDARIFQIRPVNTDNSEESWITVSKRAYDAISADLHSGCQQRVLHLKA